MFPWNELLLGIASLGSISGWTQAFRWKRQRQAQVKTEEAVMADKMIDVMDKTVDKVIKRLEEDFARREASLIQQINELKKSNDKLCRLVTKLQKAIENVAACPYRDTCPVAAELSGSLTAPKQQNGN